MGDKGPGHGLGRIFGTHNAAACCSARPRLDLDGFRGAVAAVNPPHWPRLIRRSGGDRGPYADRWLRVAVVGG